MKKNDGLTPRQRQSQQIMREKAAAKKRQARMQKLYWIGGVCGVLLIGGGSAWAWKTSAIGHAVEAVSNSVYDMTGKAGFTLQSLYLEGRNRTAMAEIEQAIGVKKGDPILRHSISDIRGRLEAIESVRFAAVERALPDTLFVRIVEREPVARWQHQGRLALVDDQGVVMNDIDIGPYAHLPLIVGDDAPKHVEEVVAMLNEQPELAKRFQAATRVGERRWNIRLANRQANMPVGVIDVKLPEHDPKDAWNTLAKLQAREQVLDRDVKMIDLRIQGRLFIKVAPQDTTDKAAGAKET